MGISNNPVKQDAKCIVILPLTKYVSGLLLNLMSFKVDNSHATKNGPDCAEEVGLRDP